MNCLDRIWIYLSCERSPVTQILIFLPRVDHKSWSNAGSSQTKSIPYHKGILKLPKSLRSCVCCQGNSHHHYTMLWPMEGRINLHAGEQNNIQNNPGLSNFEQRYFPDEPGAGHLTFLFVFKSKTLWMFTSGIDWHLLTLAMCATKEKLQMFSFRLNRSPWVRKTLSLRHPVYLQNSTCRVPAFCKMYRRILVYKCHSNIKLSTLRSS